VECRSRSLNPAADPNRASSGRPDQTDYRHNFCPRLPLQLLEAQSLFKVQRAPFGRRQLFTCWQTPALHESTVHELPSSVQGLLLLTCWHDPLPLHASFVQGFPSSVHSVPLGSLLETHVPLLQVSGLSQSVVAELPHAVPLALFGCVQDPPPHTSLVQRFPSSVHTVPLALLLVAHVPLLQVSGLSHVVAAELPHAVPFALAGWVHDPLPLHVSFVQRLPSSVHSVPLGS